MRGNVTGLPSQEVQEDCSVKTKVVQFKPYFDSPHLTPPLGFFGFLIPREKLVIFSRSGNTFSSFLQKLDIFSKVMLNESFGN